jgi:hypothetical protein
MDERCMNKVFLVTVFLLTGIVCAQNAQPLFVIERNTNSNRVYYEARIAPDSLFEARQPIHAYWIMWEKDHSGKTREELTFIEREKGYGFRVKQNPGRKFFWFSIAPLPHRLIKVSLQNATAVAETIIDGRFSVLEKITINAFEKNFLPHVKYIELFGRNAKSGEDTYERIVNR